MILPRRLKTAHDRESPALSFPRELFFRRHGIYINLEAYQRDFLWEYRQNALCEFMLTELELEGGEFSGQLEVFELVYGIENVPFSQKNTQQDSGFLIMFNRAFIMRIFRWRWDYVLQTAEIRISPLLQEMVQGLHLPSTYKVKRKLTASSQGFASIAKKICFFHFRHSSRELSRRITWIRSK